MITADLLTTCGYDPMLKHLDIPSNRLLCNGSELTVSAEMVPTEAVTVAFVKAPT